MFQKYYSIFFTTFIFICATLSQDCVFPGRYCIDDAACCGGCCRNKICMITYGPCKIQDDPCLMHYCPPGLECRIYQPDCSGCEPYAYCVDSRN